MEGTRLLILQLLQKNGRETVDGLASAIGLAPATIRRHLDILQRDRLVGFEEVRKKTGRPEYSFYLTEAGQEALPKDYDRLLNMLVGELATLTAEDTRERNGSQILELVFQRLSDQVWGGYESQVEGKSLAHRLNVLLGILREEDFFPEVEVEGDTLVIKLMNCPFRSVAMQNSSVCSFDSNLIAAMLNVDTLRGECIHKGGSCCIYRAQVSPTQAQELSAIKEG